VIEIAVTKRPALYKGEVGIFPTSQDGDEDLSRIAAGTDAWAKISTPRNARLLRYVWAIATKLAKGGVYLDKNEAMADLCVRCKHFDTFTVTDNKVVVARRSIGGGADELMQLANRMIWLICDEILPDMSESEFKAELEEMLV
jgi:hypothetical protein